MPFIVIFLFSAFSAFAEWKVRDLDLNAVPCPNKNCYISKSCLKEDTDCDALKAYQNPRKGKVGPGGSNPGSAVCKDFFKGFVNVAKDEKGNEESFCVFKDKTVLSLSGVWR